MRSLMTILLLCVLVVIPLNTVSAEQSIHFAGVSSIADNDKTNTYRINLKDWKDDTRYVFSRPLKWESSDWNKIFLYGGLTYFVRNNDEGTQKYFQERRNGRNDNVARIGNAFPVFGAAYLTGAYLFGNESQRKMGATGLESTGIALLVTETLKVATHRQRPNGDDKSFPSAHTAAAFAMATVIADEYGSHKEIPPLVYGLATLTAYARMNDNKHWGSDVLVGGLIGHYTAKTVIRLNRSRDYKLQPYLGPDHSGIVVSKQI